MLSRVAYSIYWMSRYLERSDNYARILKANLNLTIQTARKIDNQWQSILTATADDEAFLAQGQDASLENVLQFMVFSDENPNAIFSTITSARNNARKIRETILPEIWESINQSYLSLKKIHQSEHKSIETIQSFLNEVLNLNIKIAGILATTQLRDETYYFGMLGLLVERADKSLRFLDVEYFKMEDETEGYQINHAILEFFAVTHFFVKQNQTLNPSKIISFLIFEEKFPRSFTYCINNLSDSIKQISGIENTVIKIIESIQAHLSQLTMNEVLDNGLNHFVDQFQIKNNEIDQALFDLYFAFKPINQGLNGSEQ